MEPYGTGGQASEGESGDKPTRRDAERKGRGTRREGAEGVAKEGRPKESDEKRWKGRAGRGAKRGVLQRGFEAGSGLRPTLIEAGSGPP